MDNITAAAVQKAFELLKAGEKDQAHAILISIITHNPDVAQAWYLLGFTETDAAKKLSCFQQVLRIDPSNPAAQKQIARLPVMERVASEVGTSQVNPFTTLPSDSVADSKPTSTSIPTSTPISTSTPIPSSTPIKRQLSKKNLILLIGIGVAVIGVIAVFGMTALYISNGSNTAQEVNALFLQHKCVEVQGYTSFEKSFPRAIFSSYFGVYHQIEECRAQLAFEQAIKAQDWPTAYDVIENYLLLYPHGEFVAEMDAQVGAILLSWSNNLLAQKDYATAIKKLELIQTGFPNSPAVPTAVKTMLDNDLLWAKYLFEQKDYPGAEKLLKTVGSHGKASAEQAQQANQGLAVVYLQWGKAQVENGQLDEGVQHYAAAKTLDPKLTDYDLLEDQVTLNRVEALVTANNFDGALKLVKSVSETGLSDEGKADAAAEETKILDAYAHSNATQAQAQMTTAAANMCQKQTPTIPIFAMGTDSVRFAVVAPYSLQLPSGWMADTPSELHYVLCIEQTQSKVETCAYRGGYTLRRIRYAWTITLYSLATGKVFKTTKLQGTNPRPCGSIEYFYGASTNDIYGEMPSVQQIVNWLTSLKLVK